MSKAKRSPILADRKKRKERDVLYNRVQKATEGWSKVRKRALLNRHGIAPRTVSNQIDLDTYRAIAEDAEARAARTTKGKTR